MHFSLVNVVMSVAVPAVSAMVAYYYRLAARYRGRRRRQRREEWIRLAGAFQDVDRELDLVWAVESARIGRHY